MKTIQKIGYLLLITLLFAACSNSIAFNKETWLKSEGEFYIEDNNRYKMALWLEENYNFCDKKASEILDMFFDEPQHHLDFINKNKRLKLVTKQSNPNFLIGIDPWIDTDWIELYFDDNNNVSAAYIVTFNPDTKEENRRKICTK